MDYYLDIHSIFSLGGLLFSIGGGITVLFLGWKVGMSNEQRDLIMTLKTRLDLTEKELEGANEKVRQLEEYFSQEQHPPRTTTTPTDVQLNTEVTQ